MKRKPKRSARQDRTRDLALAFLGAANAADVRLRSVIDAHIDRIYEASDGNLSLTADLLDMHRRSLQRYLRARARRRKRRAGKRRQ